MELNEEGNPKILSMLYQYFYDDEKNIQIQGIFRKASSILDDREFEKEIRFKNYLEDLELNRVSNFSDDEEEYNEEQGQEGEEKYNQNEENCKQLENSQLIIKKQRCSRR
ncbi:hypothetical protein PPERSA_04041 [Pseudocohnilembus persalinus]|uniref:Uncharacterized protein n=1 Tax=Pseudocohnilembus persalinus TaxID=266149 RepID=A0A0V0QKV2_PSEPJ|nr:hypothetical protein PPERSA_04041 [Pseudocohnilembus persalinus]|eukprot:KRX02838.1 hypothetical protein PPERSA_04041 [Pseudocohnilembus persalinus]